MPNLPLWHCVGREFNILTLQLLVHLIHGGTVFWILTPSQGNQCRNLLVQQLFHARSFSIEEDLCLQFGIRPELKWLRECQHFPHEHAD